MQKTLYHNILLETKAGQIEINDVLEYSVGLKWVYFKKDTETLSIARSVILKMFRRIKNNEGTTLVPVVMKKFRKWKY